MRLLAGGQGCVPQMALLPTGACPQEKSISFWKQFQNFAELHVEDSPYQRNRIAQERSKITTLQRSLTQFCDSAMLTSARLQCGQRACVCLPQLGSSFLDAYL